MNKIFFLKSFCIFLLFYGNLNPNIIITFSAPFGLEGECQDEKLIKTLKALAKEIFPYRDYLSECNSVVLENRSMPNGMSFCRICVTDYDEGSMSDEFDIYYRPKPYHAIDSHDTSDVISYLTTDPVSKMKSGKDPYKIAYNSAMNSHAISDIILFLKIVIDQLSIFKAKLNDLLSTKLFEYNYLGRIVFNHLFEQDLARRNRIPCRVAREKFNFFSNLYSLILPCRIAQYREKLNNPSDYILRKFVLHDLNRFLTEKVSTILSEDHKELMFEHLKNKINYLLPEEPSLLDLCSKYVVENKIECKLATENIPNIEKSLNLISLYNKVCN